MLIYSSEEDPKKEWKQEKHTLRAILVFLIQEVGESSLSCV